MLREIKSKHFLGKLTAREIGNLKNPVDLVPAILRVGERE